MITKASAAGARLGAWTKRCRWSARDAAFALGLGRSRLRNRPGVRIICYHGVDEVGSTFYNSRFVSRNMLERQVAYFAREFNVVPLSQAWEEPEADGRLTVALTFDDGYRSHLTEVLPILERYAVPACFFVPACIAMGQSILWPDLLDLLWRHSTGPVCFEGNSYRSRSWGLVSTETHRSLKEVARASGPEFGRRLLEQIPAEDDPRRIPELAPYWSLLKESDLRELARSPLVTIGAHGFSHTDLQVMDQTTVREELASSRACLERKTGQPIANLAFPFGSYDLNLVELAQDAGYRRQLVLDYSDPSHAEDSRISSRFGINPFISFENQIACLLEGAY